MDGEISRYSCEQEVCYTLYSDFIRKLDEPGNSLCTWCDVTIDYGSRGFKAFHRHSSSKKHIWQLESRKTNYSISGSFGAPLKKVTPYGLNPAYVIDSTIEKNDPP